MPGMSADANVLVAASIRVVRGQAPHSAFFLHSVHPRHQQLRACLETTRGAAARDFGCGQGGEFRASPQRAVRNEPTLATDKRPAARRVFGEKAVWLRCSSVEDPPGLFSFVAPRHPAFSPKTAPLVVSKQALTA